MNKGSKTIRIIGVLLLLLTVLYFGLQIARSLYAPLRTVVAYSFTVEDGLALDGYLVREEEVLPSVSGTLSLQRAEGEKVGIGTPIATIYHSAHAQDDEQQLQQLQLRLQQLQYAQDVPSSASLTMSLDSSILRSLRSLRAAAAQQQLASLPSHVLNLKTLILKREYSPDTSSEDLSRQIQQLSDQIRVLQSSLEVNSSVISAPHSGYFSSQVDGYETVLTPARLSQLSAAELSAIAPQPKNGSPVGKLIYGVTWYYTAVIGEQDRSSFTQGSTVTLLFPEDASRRYSMTVERVGPNENGKHVLILSCDKYLSQLTLLRQTSAQVIRNRYTGLYIPAEALHMTEDGQFGVYCRIGMNARFKPVKLVYSGDGFYLVQAVEGSSTELTLRQGDELILSARDLYDGKVVE